MEERRDISVRKDGHMCPTYNQPLPCRAGLVQGLPHPPPIVMEKTPMDLEKWRREGRGGIEKNKVREKRLGWVGGMGWG